jgi:hypothetical protein
LEDFPEVLFLETSNIVRLCVLEIVLNYTKFDLRPWMMLVIRSVLFLVFQTSIGLIFLKNHQSSLWDDSAAWWPFTIILTNITCLVLLIHFSRQEGKRYWNVFKIDRQYIKKDLLFMLGFLVALGPVGFLPNILSARWLFGDQQIALDLLVRPLPVWAAMLSFLLFPLLQGIVEIPTYTLYVLPRLEKQGVKPWLAVTLTGFFLSTQHVFAPFIPDLSFITYRLVMFLPFAFLIVIVMRWRPRLMPYIGIVHVLMNISIAVMFLFAM